MSDTINWRELDFKSLQHRAILNKFISEKCGWVEIESETWWEEDFYDVGEVTGLTGIPPGSKERAIIPFYTTDLNAAIQLQHEGYRLSLVQTFNSEPELLYCAEFVLPQWNRGVGAYASTPAIAICLAWLEVGEAK